MRKMSFMSRITTRFQQLQQENRAAFIPFMMAGDPDMERSAKLLQQLPAAGADLIEIGVCFTDPMADGPAIQAAGLRALESGQTLAKTLQMIRDFREQDQDTPVEGAPGGLTLLAGVIRVLVGGLFVSHWG